MLIVEGADCLGKTTFIKALMKRANERIDISSFPIFYSHMSRPNSAFDFFEDYKDMITTYAVQDRFHLGGIVWHNAIPQERLEIIEGWLRAIGSITVILYASDIRWYEDWLTKDTRGNLLTEPVIEQANMRYIELANGTDKLRPIVDFAFDIKSHAYDEPQFVSKEQIDAILDYWFRRLSVVRSMR